MSESLKIECPSCGQNYSIEPHAAPVTVTCQVCESQFLAGGASNASKAVVATRSATSYQPPSLREKYTRFTSGQTPLWKNLLDIRKFLGWLSDGSLIRKVTALIGYLVYLFSRWLQEFLFVLPSIARNIDLIENHLNPTTASQKSQ